MGRTLQSLRTGHLLKGQDAAPWPSMTPPATVSPFTHPNSIQSLPNRFRSVAALSVPCTDRPFASHPCQTKQRLVVTACAHVRRAQFVLIMANNWQLNDRLACSWKVKVDALQGPWNCTGPR